MTRTNLGKKDYISLRSSSTCIISIIISQHPTKDNEKLKGHLERRKKSLALSVPHMLLQDYFIAR